MPVRLSAHPLVRALALVDAFYSLTPKKVFSMNVRNKVRHLFIASLLILGLPGLVAASSEEWDNTFSIVARDPVTGALGGAVSTARLAVGNRVIHVEHNVGAIATQANTNPLLAKEALQRLKNDMTAKEALDTVLQGDDRREERQLSIIDGKGNVAAFTGSKPDDYKSHFIGKDFIVAGNILVGKETLEAMASAFDVTKGTLADRVMAALEAGQKAGGDRRGKISAAIVVVNQAPSINAYAKNIDLRIDSSNDPVAELRVLYDAYKTAFKIQ